MSTHRNIDRICVVVLVLTLLLTVAFMNGKRLGIQVVADEDAESYRGSAYFTENDLDGNWADNAYTTYIILDSNGGKIDGNGAYFLNGDLVIANGGWYVISGTLKDGSIIVDSQDSSKVWIRLDGVNVNCSDDACIQINQADKVFLTLAEGTENTLTSGRSYSEDALSDNTGGVIFSHDDLTINGSGSLAIEAGYQHGIDGNDSLVITGGTISITAPQDGIHVNDSLRYTEASLTVEAGDDAIHSGDELYVESGTILIKSCYEGLEATTIDIAGGDITIYPGDDGINASNGSSVSGFGGAMGDRMPAMTGEVPHMAEKEELEKAVERDMPSEQQEVYIRIGGGNLTIINETGRDADGLDSNGSIYIDGGTILVSLTGDGSNCAIDFGSESGGKCIVTGGTVLAFGGSDMAEAFSSESTQCAILYNLDSVMQEETKFQVINSEGEEVLSYTPDCSYSSIAFSSPALTVNETYTVVSGDHSDELTLGSTAITVGDSGASAGGMQPGSRFNMKPDDLENTERGFLSEQEGISASERSASADGKRGTPPQQNDDDKMAQSLTEEAQQTDDGFTLLMEIDRNTWILLGVSFFTLAAANLFAAKYRKW